MNAVRGVSVRRVPVNAETKEARPYRCHGRADDEAAASSATDDDAGGTDDGASTEDGGTTDEEGPSS